MSVFHGHASGISCRQMEMDDGSPARYLRIWRSAWGKPSGRKPVGFQTHLKLAPFLLFSPFIAFHFSGPTSVTSGSCNNKKFGQMEEAGGMTEEDN